MYAKLVFQRCSGNAVDQPGFVVITLATILGITSIRSLAACFISLENVPWVSFSNLGWPWILSFCLGCWRPNLLLFHVSFLLYVCPGSAVLRLRISNLDMAAKRLMPIDIQQHLQALGRIASSKAQYKVHWSLARTFGFACCAEQVKSWIGQTRASRCRCS